MENCSQQGAVSPRKNVKELLFLMLWLSAEHKWQLIQETLCCWRCKWVIGGGCQSDQQHWECWTVVLHTELGKFICVYCKVTVTAAWNVGIAITSFTNRAWGLFWKKKSNSSTESIEASVGFLLHLLSAETNIQWSFRKKPVHVSNTLAVTSWNITNQGTNK